MRAAAIDPVPLTIPARVEIDLTSEFKLFFSPKSEETTLPTMTCGPPMKMPAKNRIVAKNETVAPEPKIAKITNTKAETYNDTTNPTDLIEK